MVERCQLRAKSCVWWPGITNHIKEMIQNCPVCAQNLRRRKEPLIATLLPHYLCQRMASDLFELHGKYHLLIVDYFPRYPEVMNLTNTTSAAVISALKSIFTRHRIPKVLRTTSHSIPHMSSPHLHNHMGFSITPAVHTIP